MWPRDKSAFRHNNTKRNILSNAAYNFTSSVKDAEYKCVNVNRHENNFLQRSVSADDVVVRSRGFKPSDRHDPAKRNFLESLTSKILHFEMGSGEATPIDLKKLLTPASDSNGILHTKNKKMFASSYFYAPTHPTVEDQVELARQISHSLSDVRNMRSKGQSMYVNRKKRSVKWIHDGNGADDNEEPPSPTHKDKVPLKCMMNPNGKVLDIHGIQALGEEVNIEPIPAHPEKLFDIVRDLNNQKGRGAEIFAKRRKRSEKWVVDQDQPETPMTPGLPKAPFFSTKQEAGVKENTKLPTVEPLPPLTPIAETKPFYNPFTLDLSLDSVNTPGNDRVRYAKSADHSALRSSQRVRSREIAVGTDFDHPQHFERNAAVEKSRRYSFEATDEQYRLPVRPALNHTNRSNNTNANCYNNINKPTKNVHVDPRNQFFSNPPYNTKKPTKMIQPNNRANVAYFNNSGKPSKNFYVEPNNRLDNARFVNGNKPSKSAHADPSNRSDNENSDYTPVPVKELIKEFEKTCRPAMQYKQISPKIVPMIQVSPLQDGNLSRYFESNVPSNYENMRPGRRIVEYVEEDEEEEEEDDDDEEELEEDDEEDDEDDDDDDDEFEEVQLFNQNGYAFYNQTDRRYHEKAPIHDESRSRPPDSDPRSPVPGGGCRSMSMSQVDEYYRRRLANLRLQETEPEMTNGRDVTFADTEAAVPPEAKSLVLAMVASQEDILETIKRLRNTPVLDNLALGASSPDFKFSDSCGDVGTKLTEGNYQGPKVSSFQTLTNYNTAPRGWNQSLAYYRPVTFGKPQETIVYSDF